MEAKLAEFRKKQNQNKPWINWSQLRPRFPSLFTSSSTIESNNVEESEESSMNWKIIILKFFIWLTLLVIFIRLEFGVIYFIISLLYLMWSSLDSRRRRNHLSAYSVFNPNCEKIQGTFSGEDYDRQLRRGGSPLFSS